MLASPLAVLVTTLPLTALPSGACHCGGPAAGCTKVWWMPPLRRASTLFWVNPKVPLRGAARCDSAATATPTEAVHWVGAFLVVGVDPPHRGDGGWLPPSPSP